MLDGFCRVVVRPALTYWFPPLPPLPVILTFPRPAVCPKPLMPTYVAAINRNINVPKNGKLTLQSGRNIERDVRDGHIADCCPRHNIYGAFEFELDTLSICDSCKERSKKCVVQGMKRLLREGNFEICDVPGGYATISVGKR